MSKLRILRRAAFALLIMGGTPALALNSFPRVADRVCSTLGPISAARAEVDRQARRAFPPRGGWYEDSVARRYEAVLYEAAGRGSTEPGFELTPASLDRRAHVLARALAREVRAAPGMPEGVQEDMIARLEGFKVVTA